MAYQSVNPYTEKLEKEFASHTDKELDGIIAQAHAAFQNDWRSKTMEERKALMKKAAAILRAQRVDFAKLITLEMGKLFSEALGEVDLSADILDYYADNAASFLAPEKLAVDEGEAYIESDPIGVLFCVEPWNFPYYQLARVAGPNLMAGNTLVVKHAANVPQCALAFEKLFYDAGAPKGVYTNVFLSNEQSATAIADKRIKGVALTGSERAGSAVAAEAGKALKKNTMELGGSDAFLVLDDADMDTAIKWGVWGRMNNTGQCCVAAKRFILDEKIADVFLTRFQEELSKLIPGDPMDEKTTLGPLCTAGALDLVQKQIDTALSGGAKVLMGGKRLDRPGYFLEPTVLTDITPQNPVYYQEFFAPVALIFRVKNEHEAIRLANDSPYGLGGSVITTDIVRGKHIASQIETGMVFINQATWTAPNLPFGGIKNSGYGRELSDLGIGEFINKKLVRVA
ncbi:NAD-dependent succinate-semialdehyde dehydrogenase [Granulicella tundricola]|uniref:Aldehyde Dehydrogenase n=1 Tax=Granulicella tundricola (strain ATCC BAA-1859 / DSM 23138 / MP5ACTX9) TaxID=1198114 RepID=E8X7D8_GRATM|nr:NAD-dependent succinate-semialdehyde dehydrogenase [Granulicella tundricola]ADW71372.1 Aldehyde Dehydrogenase [Granulicella tundricola MP5ACTX9]